MDRLRSLWPRKKTQPLRRSEPAPARRPSPSSANDRRPDAPTVSLPRFHTTAADHVDRERSDPRARERVRLRNSFMPAQPVADPRMFAGRRDILEVLIRAVEDQRSHVMIFGERGAGKTSLLRMLSRAAGEAKYIVVYFSCGATSDFSETFRAVATEIPLLYHSSISPISSNSDVGTSLSDLLGPGKLTPRLFGDAAAKLVGTRVLVVLDEFDRAESPEFRRDVAELIKTLSDVSARLQLIIAGVASDLSDLMEHIPSIRRSVVASFAMLPILFLTIRASDARLGIVGMLISLLLYGMLWSIVRWRSHPRDLFAAATVYAYPAIFLLGISVVFASTRLRAMVLGDGAQASSTEARSTQLGMAMAQMWKAPWGHGAGQSGNAMGYAEGAFITIDNYFIGLALDYGVLGIIFWYGMFIVGLVEATRYSISSQYAGRTESRLLAPLAVVLAAFLVIKWVHGQDDNHPIYFMVLGMISALIYRLRNNAPGTPPSNPTERQPSGGLVLRNMARRGPQRMTD